MTIESPRPTALDSEPYPPLRAAWMALALLLLAYTCSFIDRQILSLLVQPIRADLAISDTQLSLLQGISFAFFYSIARHSLRHGRRPVAPAEPHHRLACSRGASPLRSAVSSTRSPACSSAAWPSESVRPALRPLRTRSSPTASGRSIAVVRSRSTAQARTSAAGLALVAGGGVIAFSGDASAALCEPGIRTRALADGVHRRRVCSASCWRRFCCSSGSRFGAAA